MQLRSRQERKDSGKSSNFATTLLYDLRINGDHNSPEGSMKIQRGGKTVEIYGRYEPVIFLGDFNRMPCIDFHAKKSGKEKVLAGSNFSPDDPVGKYYWDNRESDRCVLKGQQVSIFLPVLAIRRQDKPNRNKRGGLIQPVHWFELEASSYIENHKENAERLEAANEKYPLTEYVYRIFAENRGEKEKQRFHFEPMKKDGKPIKLEPQWVNALVKTDHPLVTDWVDNGKFIWDQDYYSMVTALAIVRFQKFLNPDTGEVYDYGGEYDNAMEIFNEYRDHFPPPAERVSSSNYAEEADEDIPF